MDRRQFTQSIMATAVGMGLTRNSAAQSEAAGTGQAPFRFSVMLWTLNKIAPFDQAIELVAKAGYTGIELVSEWRAWSDADFARITARLKALGLRVDSMAGVKGSFADPAGGDALLADLTLAFAAAKKLGCGQIILTSGKRLESSSLQGCVDNLKRVAALAEKAGIQVVIEPIDLLENATMYLTSVTEGFAMARAVDSPQVRVLYDFYHEQKQGGNLLDKLEKNIDLVALVHIADVPGRHRPGTGEIRYEAIYRLLGTLNYSGYVAMEFYPLGDPVTELRAAREEAIRAARG